MDIKEKIKQLVEKYESEKSKGKISQYTEAETKTGFIEPLFQALGWDTQNRDEVGLETNVSGGRVDYSFKISGIIKFFVEAKALRADLDNPQYAQQAINYAWHKGVVWTVLTDFESVKVFNAEWKTKSISENLFFEIKYTEYLKNFDQLYLLSKQAILEGLLDKEAEKWGKKLKRQPVSKQILDDLLEARKKLTKSILNHPRINKISELELDESVQRILDRLIFIRTCEDRNIEQNYLLAAVRNKNKKSLWEELKKIFRRFDELYNSKLFEKHLCEQLFIDDEILEEVINSLYYTKDGNIYYDFSAINADVLGNIYEQYLGHILKKTPTSAKLKETHQHRKEQGIYYTPTYIVDYIVKNTVGEILKNIKPKNAMKLRILDPACGSGSFLIRAFDELVDYWQKVSPSEFGYFRKIEILKNNIYGVDLDRQAVEITQMNLLLKTLQHHQKLPVLKNIKQGNSLIDDTSVAGENAFKWEEEFKEVMQKGGFDVVIGNPPYVDSEEMVKTQPKLREAYSKIYTTAKGNWDIFCIFIEKGLSLLKNGGYFGMIVPNKLLSADYALEIRKLIQKNYKIISIRDYSKIPVFQASVYPIVIIIKKEMPKKNKFLAEVMIPYGDSAKLGFSNIIEQETLQEIPHNTWSYIFSEFSTRIIDKILSNSITLYEIADVSGAATVSEAYEIKKIIKELSNQKDYFKFINTGTIDRYSSLWGCSKTIYIKVAYNKPVVLKEDLKKLSNKRYLESLKEKIIVAGMTKRLECYLDSGCCLAGKSTTIITSEKVNLKYIIGILNSTIMTFIYKNLFKSLSLAGGYIRVGPPQIKKLPIKLVPESQQQPIIQLVDKMLELNKRLNELGDKITDERRKIEEEIQKTDKQIDKLVYKLYGLTEEEIKVVEGYNE
jgi:type I restriction-modification system DNA methylase subunit